MSMRRSLEDPDQAVSIVAILFFVRAAFEGIPLLGALIGGSLPVFLLLAIAYAVAGYGLLKSQRWAWPLAVGAAVVGAVQSLLSLPFGILGLLFDALILYLLFRPAVRERFGQLRQG
jgi:hypothetical protein